MFVDGGGADGFREPTVCPTAAEVSIRASRAIVVISFRMMDLPSWGDLKIHGSGEARPQGAQTSHFVQMFQGRRPLKVHPKWRLEESALAPPRSGRGSRLQR